MTRIDFVVLWVATFFVNASTTIVQLFGLYFFRDVITEPDLEFFDWIVFVSPESATAFYTTVYTAGTGAVKVWWFALTSTPTGREIQTVTCNGGGRNRGGGEVEYLPRLHRPLI